MMGDGRVEAVLGVPVARDAHPNLPPLKICDSDEHIRDVLV